MKAKNAEGAKECDRGKSDGGENRSEPQAICMFETAIPFTIAPPGHCTIQRPAHHPTAPLTGHQPLLGANTKGADRVWHHAEIGDSVKVALSPRHQLQLQWPTTSMWTVWSSFIDVCPGVATRGAGSMHPWIRGAMDSRRYIKGGVGRCTIAL